jgi:hypothetical protein
MTNIKEYTPTETSVIEINEAGVRNQPLKWALGIQGKHAKTI